MWVRKKPSVAKFQTELFFIPQNMEETLKKNIRKFLETISTFVQVILFKIPPETEVMEWESAEQTM